MQAYLFTWHNNYFETKAEHDEMWKMYRATLRLFESEATGCTAVFENDEWYAFDVWIHCQSTIHNSSHVLM